MGGHFSTEEPSNVPCGCGKGDATYRCKWRITQTGATLMGAWWIPTDYPWLNDRIHGNRLDKEAGNFLFFVGCDNCLSPDQRALFSPQPTGWQESIQSPVVYEEISFPSHMVCSATGCKHE